MDKAQKRIEQARERKRRQRQREAAHKAAVGAKTMQLELYRGTAEALQRLCEKGGFEEPAEVITLLIHGADDLAKRDMSRFTQLVSVTSHAGGGN